MVLEEGMVHYEELNIEVVEDTYIVSAHGYQQRFERLSDSVIRDTNRTNISKSGLLSLRKILTPLKNTNQ